MNSVDDMVCFSLYAATRATTQAYRTLLEPLGLTYPQYLVLVVLGTEGEQTVRSLGDRLQLDSGTLSPLLRRMESSGLVTRARASDDERVVTIALGERAAAIAPQLAGVPGSIAACFGIADAEEAAALVERLHHVTETMRATTPAALASA